jgi:Tfp pilus assembly protein PilN
MMQSMDNVDFLPERIRIVRARRLRVIREAYLLTICIGGLVLLGYVRSGRVARAQADLHALNGRVANVQHQLVLRDSLEAQQADLMIMKLIEADLGSRVNVLDVLSELESVVPKSIALQNLSLETTEERVPIKSTHDGVAAKVALGSPEKKERTIRRVRLVITGLSPTDIDVANFIGQLSGSPLFEDVNMGYTRNEEFEGRQARKFQASCHVVR